MSIDEKAAEAVFQKFKHVKPRLNRAAIRLLCEAYEAAKASEQAIAIEQVQNRYSIEPIVHTEQPVGSFNDLPILKHMANECGGLPGCLICYGVNKEREKNEILGATKVSKQPDDKTMCHILGEAMRLACGKADYNYYYEKSIAPKVLEAIRPYLTKREYVDDTDKNIFLAGFDYGSGAGNGAEAAWEEYRSLKIKPIDPCVDWTCKKCGANTPWRPSDIECPTCKINQIEVEK